MVFPKTMAKPLRPQLRYLNAGALQNTTARPEELFGEIVSEFIQHKPERANHVRRCVYTRPRNWMRPPDAESVTVSEIAQEFHNLFWRQRYRDHREQILAARRERRRHQSKYPHREHPFTRKKKKLSASTQRRYNT
jgi:hypothetical protein